MKTTFESITNHQEFTNRIFHELQKLPFGSLPKTELELLILDALVRSLSNENPYANIQRHFSTLKTELKLSQTQLKNKLLAAQLRYDVQTDKDVELFILNSILSGNYLIENNTFILNIFNPLLNDQAKSYFEIRNIFSDTSFNKSILRINLNGIIQFLKSLNCISESKKLELEKILKEAQEEGLIHIIRKEKTRSALEKTESVSVIGDNFLNIIEKLSKYIPTLLSMI